VYFMTWLIVGLFTGLLAAAFVRRVGYGLLVDMAVGIAGGVVGGWIIETSAVRIPLDPGPAALLVAFAGATVALGVLRVFGWRRRTVQARPSDEPHEVRVTSSELT
jgi:uncharacterized membrane protein YeaQ/YmgE (transglycosylase-associated protein family)